LTENQYRYEVSIRKKIKKEKDLSKNRVANKVLIDFLSKKVLIDFLSKKVLIDLFFIF